MRKNILIIGGTRFFGKHLVRRLLAEGHKVSIATRGITPDDFGDTVRRIQVDRRNLPAMQAAFAHASFFDAVYDQMCYSPLDASIALKVFGGKTERYIMTSTIEVYRHLSEKLNRPFMEDDIDLKAEAIDLDFPWRDPVLAETSYAAGKLQAEALLMQDGRLPAVTLRVAHVLAAQEDFTARLASYVATVEQVRPFYYRRGAGVTSFLNTAEIADFMLWAGKQEFLGPVNAACVGSLSALDLHQHICRVVGKSTSIHSVADDGPSHSPFDYAHCYGMDTSRADRLGYRFSETTSWLDQLIREVYVHLYQTVTPSGE